MKTLLLAAFSAALIGCGGKTATTTTTTAAWTAEQDQTYIKECIGNGSVPGAQEMCACYLEKIKAEKMTFEDYTKKDPRITAGYEKWTTDCMGLPPTGH